MKTSLSIIFLGLSLLSTQSFAGQESYGVPSPTQELCGKLNAYCVNGNARCRKFITPTYCINGGSCVDGKPVRVEALNPEALKELETLLGLPDGTRICARGLKNEKGIFQATFAYQEQ